MLAEAVEGVLKQKGWSIRRAATNAGIEPNQIVRMKSGLSVRTDALIRFARTSAGKERPLSVIRKFLGMAGEREIIGLLDETRNEMIQDPAAGAGGMLVNALEYIKAAHQDDIVELADGRNVLIIGMESASEPDKQLVKSLIARLMQES